MGAHRDIYLRQNPKDDDRIYTTVVFNEDEEPPSKYPDATTNSYMWQNADGRVLTETIYEIE